MSASSTPVGLTAERRREARRRLAALDRRLDALESGRAPLTEATLDEIDIGIAQIEFELHKENGNARSFH